MTGTSSTDNVLVIGASGLVGGAIYDACKKNNVSVVGTYNTNKKDDLVQFTTGTDAAAFLDAIKPSTIIVCSALSYVDYCESHELETMRRNVEELQPFVTYCKQHNTKLIFISTDYVFDGRNGPYDEEAERNPLNQYAISKVRGENLVRTVPNHAIIRTTNVFDFGYDKKNFLNRVVTCLRDGKELTVPSDQYATPAYSTWLGEQLVALLQKDLCSGTINIVCDDVLSRVEFAKKVANVLGADENLILGITTAELNQPARRPLQGGLRNDKLKRLLGIASLRVEDALQDVLPRMRKLYEQ